jgi:cytoskeletal protein CcmA (bactofilin family)
MLRKAAPGETFAGTLEDYRVRDTTDSLAHETASEPAFDDARSAGLRPSRVTEGAGEGAAPVVKGESLIDAQSSFEGRFESAQDLLILGAAGGEIVCRGTLTIERDASVKAKIEARDAVVRGRIEGDIVCTGRLVLTATANVTGTVKAASLAVEEGAVISGNVQAASDGTLSPAIPEVTAPRTTISRKAVSESAEVEEPIPSAGNGSASTRWTGRREVPTFALVSSDPPAGRGQ